MPIELKRIHYIGAAVVAIAAIFGYMYWKKRASGSSAGSFDPRNPRQLRPQGVQPAGVPKYTWPIQGVCGDGELVEVVLGRLQAEGNPDKLQYFRHMMGMDRNQSGQVPHPGPHASDPSDIAEALDGDQ